jgi:CheY-like chemotaxis protein
MKGEILVVDDDPVVRESAAKLLLARGYEVLTAEGGFAALEHLRMRKWVLPDLIVCELNMPEMSGFEFLSIVRRRFPKISVIAMSGAYGGEVVPGGVLADSFFAKDQHSYAPLLKTIAELINTSAERATVHQREPAPVWVPRNGKNAQGTPFIIVNCTECLRSFSLNVAEEAQPRIETTTCIYCHNTVRYIIDFSLAVASPTKPARKAAA